MAQQSAQLHTDQDSKRTSAVYSDDGNGTSRWLLWSRNAILELLARAEDAAHVTADRGIMALAVRRDTPAAGSDTDGDYEALQTNDAGALRVSAGEPLDHTTSTALADDLVVKASAGTLHHIEVTIASGADGYLQVHDATSQPADTAVPELVIPVRAASAEVHTTIALPGHVCGTGIVLVWSTTKTTLTAGAAAMFATAYYE